VQLSLANVFPSVTIFTNIALFAMSRVRIPHVKGEGKFHGRGFVLILVLSLYLPASGCLGLFLRVAFWLSELFSLLVFRPGVFPGALSRGKESGHRYSGALVSGCA